MCCFSHHHGQAGRRFGERLAVSWDHRLGIEHVGTWHPWLGDIHNIHNIIYGMSSFPLTNMFKMVKTTTNQINIHNHPISPQKQGCRLSRRPQKGQRVISLCFFKICFSLWFRSDSLSVSPESGLQIHCVFQGFLFLFSNVLFFPCKLKVFLRSGKKKKTYFFDFMQ